MCRTARNIFLKKSNHRKWCKVIISKCIINVFCIKYIYKYTIPRYSLINYRFHKSWFYLWSLPMIKTSLYAFLIFPKLFEGNMIIGKSWIGLIKIYVFVVVTSCCESLGDSPRNNHFFGHKTTLMPKHTTIIICFKVWLYY